MKEFANFETIIANFESRLQILKVRGKYTFFQERTIPFGIAGRRDVLFIIATRYYPFVIIILCYSVR